jgi:hypothetical protein
MLSLRQNTAGSRISIEALVCSHEHLRHERPTLTVPSRGLQARGKRFVLPESFDTGPECLVFWQSHFHSVKI